MIAAHALLRCCVPARSAAGRRLRGRSRLSSAAIRCRAPNYKEAGDWKPSEPNDVLRRADPGGRYSTTMCSNRLEAQIDISNQNVKAAEAAFEQSRALVAQARAGFWPTVRQLGRAAARQRGATNAAGAAHDRQRTQNTSRRRLGQLGHGYLGPASAATPRATAPRRRPAPRRSRRRGCPPRPSSRPIISSCARRINCKSCWTTRSWPRHCRCKSPRAATNSAWPPGPTSSPPQTQLLSSQAQQVNAKIQRAILEHAIAVLIGKQPAEFSLGPSIHASDVPTVPAGVPSTLLERRPDVAEAERRMAAANAQIGVAKGGLLSGPDLAGSDQYTEHHACRS